MNQPQACPSGPLRFVFALPGFHREERGAEVALLAVAQELGRLGDKVIVFGGGPARAGTAYEYIQVTATNRRRLEWLPLIPPFRSDTVWEDAIFGVNLARAMKATNFDVSITCNFPFSHWILRRAGKRQRGSRHLFVTQNGDWPAFSDAAEFRYFDCDGLVCTNPDYRDHNQHRWNTALIPNGIDPERYSMAQPDRAAFGIRGSGPVVLMASALIESKRVIEGISAVARLPDAQLIVAGDGPLRDQVDAAAATLLPGRFKRFTVAAERMPALYRSADVFLHLSLQESFGNVYVEAMASGLPIVAHDSSRLRWIVGDRDTLCDTQDPGALDHALVRALAEGAGPPDPRASGFGWANITAQYRAFAVQVLAGRDRS